VARSRWASPARLSPDGTHRRPYAPFACEDTHARVASLWRAHPARCVPNLAAKPKGEKRLLLADEVAALRDVAQLALRRPVDRGFVVNTQLQRDIWERVFKQLLKVSVAATTCRL
jgi:putative heme iron utilization protein